jgi:hypothetical protein
MVSYIKNGEILTIFSGVTSSPSRNGPLRSSSVNRRIEYDKLLAPSISRSKVI